VGLILTVWNISWSNGADIVSMSFMIVNRDLGQIRGLFRNAFEHLSLGGVLAVGGAGNYGPQVASGDADR
jgi:hypothetical protein